MSVLKIMSILSPYLTGIVYMSSKSKQINLNSAKELLSICKTSVYSVFQNIISVAYCESCLKKKSVLYYIQVTAIKDSGK